jgi:hypothetical protein
MPRLALLWLMQFAALLPAISMRLRLNHPRSLRWNEPEFAISDKGKLLKPLQVLDFFCELPAA